MDQLKISFKNNDFHFIDHNNGKLISNAFTFSILQFYQRSKFIYRIRKILLI